MSRTKKDADRRGIDDFDFKIKKKKTNVQKKMKNIIHDDYDEPDLRDLLKR